MFKFNTVIKQARATAIDKHKTGRFKTKTENLFLRKAGTKVF